MTAAERQAVARILTDMRGTRADEFDAPPAADVSSRLEDVARLYERLSWHPSLPDRGMRRALRADAFLARQLAIEVRRLP